MMSSHKVAILISGGLDSFVAYYYAKSLGYEPFCIFVDLGQPYIKKELKAINFFPFKVHRIRCDILRKEFDNLPTIKKQVIPARNLLLAFIGAFYCDRVWICALEGEIHKYLPDKSPRFFKEVPRVFSYYFEKKIIVESPFTKMTKTDLVKWALKNRVPLKIMLKTSTCYHERFFNCGECSTCVKRWIAFKNNDISEIYKKNPPSSQAGKELLAKYRKAIEEKDYSHYSKKRIKELLMAFGLEE